MAAKRCLGLCAKAATIPAGMLAPERDVLTPSPANCDKMFTKFEVDVVLPLVPEIKTTSRFLVNSFIAFG